MSAYGDTNINGYQGQIKASDQPSGYFMAGNEIMDLIREACNDQYNDFIQRIGIEAPEGTQILINNKSIKIGKTNMYEAQNVNITSLTFVQNSDRNVVIDYII